MFDWVKSSVVDPASRALRGALGSFTRVHELAPAWVTVGSIRALESKIEALQKRVGKLEAEPRQVVQAAPSSAARFAPLVKTPSAASKPPRHAGGPGRLPSASLLQSVQLRSMKKKRTSTSSQKPPRAPREIRSSLTRRA